MCIIFSLSLMMYSCPVSGWPMSILPESLLGLLDLGCCREINLKWLSLRAYTFLVVVMCVKWQTLKWFTNSNVKRWLYICVLSFQKVRSFNSFLSSPCLISREVQASRAQHDEFSSNTVDLSPYLDASAGGAWCWSSRSWRCNCALIRCGSQHHGHLCLLGDIRKKAKRTDLTLKDCRTRLHPDHTENHCAIEARPKVWSLLFPARRGWFHTLRGFS